MRACRTYAAPENDLPATVPVAGFHCTLLALHRRLLHLRVAARSFRRSCQASPLSFPRDFGAHPDFRNEWWYVTGWLETPDKKPLGFQITFFRFATEHDRANPSRFAPKQLIIAHAALSDPAVGKLLHDQKSAREGFRPGLYQRRQYRCKAGRLDHAARGKRPLPDQHKSARLHAALLADAHATADAARTNKGFSRKGPRPEQASYYYSEPQLR